MAGFIRAKEEGFVRASIVVKLRDRSSRRNGRAASQQLRARDWRGKKCSNFVSKILSMRITDSKMIEMLVRHVMPRGMSGIRSAASKFAKQSKGVTGTE